MLPIDYSPTRKSDNGPVPESVSERFWRKVPDRPESGCWLWRGTKQKRDAKAGGDPYGFIAVRLVNGKYRMAYAHRVAWELHNGPIPDGLEICHTCDTRLCVRVSHMFLGTRSDNIRDCVAKGRNRPCGLPPLSQRGFVRMRMPRGDKSVGE